MPTRRLLALGIASAIALVPTPVAADVPDDKTERIREFQAERLEFTGVSSTSYELKRGTGTASVRVGDLEVARRSGDPELLGQVEEGLRNRAWVQLAWTTGIPLGTLVFTDNFFGSPRPTGLQQGFPAPVVSFYPGNDLRSYALAAGGAALAAYGVTHLISWVSERLGWSFPNLLAPEAAKRGVSRANARLMDELALVPADLAAATTSLAATPGATASAPTSLKGEEGSAAYYVARATETLRNQRGEGYRLFMVYTKELSDQSGKLQRGAWHYLFYHPQKLETQEVTVPIFGASPTVGPIPEAYKDWRSAPDLSAQWKIDSPRALSQLSEALLNRGKAWIPGDTAMLLYPYFGSFQVPVWLLDQGQGPLELEVGLDASSSTVIDVRQSNLGIQPGTSGANPGGTGAPARP